MYTSISEIAKLQRENTAAGIRYYQVNMQPADWYRWFQKSKRSSGKTEKDGDRRERSDLERKTKDAELRGSREEKWRTKSEEDSGWTEVIIKPQFAFAARAYSSLCVCVCVCVCVIVCVCV